MDKIIINSGLNSFNLLDSIISIDHNTIHTTKTFLNAPFYLAIEAMAQTGAMHVRFIKDLKQHAFLLTIKKFLFPSEINLLNGIYSFNGELQNQSDLAFFYFLKGISETGLEITGEFIFATTDYDSFFKKELLEQHYKNIFRRNLQ
ncbi:MAG: hypothetical protein HQK79_19345 [Desulfobacterales bacterium]|nr:hypothetical protein [Desulfobacterales bacterium]MBF0395845.1 hypothetical protein [Desulfobacterales bacterium]